MNERVEKQLEKRINSIEKKINSGDFHKRVDALVNLLDEMQDEKVRLEQKRKQLKAERAKHKDGKELKLKVTYWGGSCGAPRGFKVFWNDGTGWIEDDLLEDDVWKVHGRLSYYQYLQAGISNNKAVHERLEQKIEQLAQNNKELVRDSTAWNSIEAGSCSEKGKVNIQLTMIKMAQASEHAAISIIFNELHRNEAEAVRLNLALNEYLEPNKKDWRADAAMAKEGYRRRGAQAPASVLRR